MKQSPRTERTGRSRAVQVEEIYLPEPRNWSTIFENNGAIPR